MKFRIVSDSGSDLIGCESIFTKANDLCDYVTAPLTIHTESKSYTDDKDLDAALMLEEIKASKQRSHTSCPNVSDYLSAFGESECVFVFTITRNLSGSYNSALNAKRDYLSLHPERRVHIFDTLTTGPETVLLITKLLEELTRGENFEQTVAAVEEYQRSTALVFCLESLDNLARNGRVSQLKAKLSGILGIRVIGKASDEGTLELTDKSRGQRAAVTDILSRMKKEGYTGGKVFIHHCSNPPFADAVRSEILNEFQGAEVSIAKTRGLCSFYAERGGILVGFERVRGA